jgi:LmbE family N-acetylglucosaminyl deacetylase
VSRGNLSAADRLSQKKESSNIYKTANVKDREEGGKLKKGLFVSCVITCLAVIFVLAYKEFLIPHGHAHAISPKNTDVLLKTNIPKPIDSGKNVVVYLVPHQDDEVLTYSVPILNDMREGKKVYLVLMSEGEGSFARQILNGVYEDKITHRKIARDKRVFCPVHKRYHDPKREHYLISYLTPQMLGELRVREFYNSAAALGIPKSQVRLHFLNMFSYSLVKNAILQEAQNFPNAEFKSMSALDYHPEHAMCGKVLDDLYQKRLIKKPETDFASIYTDRFSKIKLRGYRLYLTNPADADKVRKALQAYKTWNPSKGEYAIGYHSVPEQFDSMTRKIYTKIITEKVHVSLNRFPASLQG